MKGFRPIKSLPAESLRGLEQEPIAGAIPRVELVDPRHLFVEDAYQRSMSGENSTRLIRRIVGKFNWSRFKPPICVRLKAPGNPLVCIDGQHTATAAATRGLVKIPVLIVSADAVADRANAFVGHNRDRLNLTQMAIYKAELAAGDDLAKAIDRALKRAGAEVLLVSISLKEATPPGKTIAVGALRVVAKNHGEAFLGRVLSILTDAGRGPIKAEEIYALAALLAADPTFKDAAVRDLVAAKTAAVWSAAAASIAASTGGKASDHLARIWETNLLGDAVDEEPPPAPAPAAAVNAGKAPEKGGVLFKFSASTIKHRGVAIALTEHGFKLVEALTRVLPAMLPYEVTARKVFGSAEDARTRVDRLVNEVNPLLAPARLEIKTVPKMGNTLFDLGAA